MRNLLLIAAFVSLPLLAWVPAASADESCGGDTCATADDFESDTNGWEPAEPGTVAEWAASGTYSRTCNWWEFYCSGWTSTASGVLNVHINPPLTYVALPAATIHKWVDLTPGTYKVISRFSADPIDVAANRLLAAVSVAVNYNNTTAQLSTEGGWTTSSRQFTQFESSTFTIDRAGSAELVADFSGAPIEHMVSVDFIWLVRVSDSYPTPNPALPTLPAYATPPPLPTEACRLLQPTPTPGAFSLTPTATPPASFYNHETFNTGTGNWGRVAGTVDWVSQNHGNSIDLGAVRLAYSLVTDTFTSRSALAFQFSPAITGPVYLNGFVYVNNAILAGASAYLEVWYLDGGDVWHSEQEHLLGAGSWRPFHSQMPSGTIKALGLAARRSDGDTAQTITVDDLTVYNRYEERPLCSLYNGSTPQTADANLYPRADVYSINVPNGRDCPPASLDVPNNFWGPLLAGLTVFLDRITAPFPGHSPGTTTTAASELSQAPVWQFLAIIASLWDLRPILAAAGLLIALEGVRAVWSLWLFVKRTVPFLGG